jgi:hypothetical protein
MKVLLYVAKTLLYVICGALIGAVVIGSSAFIYNSRGGDPNSDGLTRDTRAMYAPEIGLYCAVLGLVPGAIVGAIYGVIRSSFDLERASHQIPERGTTDHKV